MKGLAKQKKKCKMPTRPDKIITRGICQIRKHLKNHTNFNYFQLWFWFAVRWPIATLVGAPPRALTSPPCANCCMPPGVGSCPLRLPLDQPRHYLLNSLKLLAGKPPFSFFIIMTGIFAMALFHGARGAFRVLFGCFNGKIINRNAGLQSRDKDSRVAAMRCRFIASRRYRRMKRRHQPSQRNPPRQQQQQQQQQRRQQQQQQRSKKVWWHRPARPTASKQKGVVASPSQAASAAAATSLPPEAVVYISILIK